MVAGEEIVSRIALVPSEALRPRMAGIGLRYLELARRLPRPGVEVVVFTPGDPAEVPEVPGEVRRLVPGNLPALFADCDGAVGQGQLVNDLVLECPELPTAVDLYDPWLVENLHYYPSLGLDPYRNDHATWTLQMSRGDFFLCSSEEQRLFYTGFLAALGRVNPERMERDPTLAGLIAAVPFGVPAAEDLPPHRPILEELGLAARDAGNGAAPARLLFGGLYDWYDPWPLLEALGDHEGRPWELLVVESPNPEGTPQRLFEAVRAHCTERGWWGSRVRPIPWVPFERRYDLLRDVDALVATHLPSLETDLAMRTRFLDAFAAGCPAITSDGGAVARMVREAGAGWVAPPGSAAALSSALGELFTALEAGGEGLGDRRRAARELADRFAWERVLGPLVEFCRDPRRDPTRDDFAHRPATHAPQDSFVFRLRRRLRREWEEITRPVRSPGNGGA